VSARTVTSGLFITILIGIPAMPSIPFIAGGYFCRMTGDTIAAILNLGYKLWHLSQISERTWLYLI